MSLKKIKSQNHHPQNVPHEQGEGVLGRHAEVGPLDRGHDVRVAVDEAHELLEAVEAALAHADEASGQVVVVALQLGLDVGEDGARHADDGDDQRSERNRAQVEEHGVLAPG